MTARRHTPAERIAAELATNDVAVALGFLVLGFLIGRWSA